MPSNFVLNMLATFLALVNTTLITGFIYTICKTQIEGSPIFIPIGGVIFIIISLVILYWTWKLTIKLWVIDFKPKNKGNKNGKFSSSLLYNKSINTRK